MRRQFYVLETRNHWRWGATEHIGRTKASVDPRKNECLRLDGLPGQAGQATQYRIKRYVPDEPRPWWKIW